MLSITKKQQRIKNSRGYEEARLAFRITNMGNTYGSNNKGNKISDEQKKIQSEKMKGRYDGKNNPYFGKKHTDEIKLKISNKAKGRLGNKAKIVLDLNTGVFYNSGKEAAFYNKINPSTLKSMLNGDNPNKTSLIYV